MGNLALEQMTNAGSNTCHSRQGNASNIDLPSVSDNVQSTEEDGFPASDIFEGYYVVWVLLYNNRDMDPCCYKQVNLLGNMCCIFSELHQVFISVVHKNKHFVMIAHLQGITDQPPNG